jgi:hypothetical protein
VQRAARPPALAIVDARDLTLVEEYAPLPMGRQGSQEIDRMGTLISKNKASAQICGDLATAVSKSGALGGKVAEIAAEEIGPVHAAVGQVEVDLSSARVSAAPVLAALQVAHTKAVDAIQLTYDIAWNYVGRPAFDQHLARLFPNGSAHYIEGEPDKLPQRIELLARLFEKTPHPRLSKDQNDGFAASLREAAQAHSDAIEAARLPAMEVVLLERTQTAMGRSAHSALASFKRRLKAAGFTEAQIHEIIPNRPVAPAKKKAEAGATPTAPAPIAPTAPPTPTAGSTPAAGSGSTSTAGSGSTPATGTASGSGSSLPPAPLPVPAAPTAPAQDGAGN